MDIEKLKKAKELCIKKERLEKDLKSTGYSPDNMWYMITEHCGEENGKQFRVVIEGSGRKLLTDKLNEINLEIESL